MTRESWGSKLEERVVALEAHALPEDWHGEHTFVEHEIRLDRLDKGGVPRNRKALYDFVSDVIDTEARVACARIAREKCERREVNRKFRGDCYFVAFLALVCGGIGAAIMYAVLQ